MTYKVYLALGSNIGNREKNLSDALDNLKASNGIEVVNVSKIYETEPVGYLNQGNFLNMVILISTNKEPMDLLKELQKIEEDMKRIREIHWGPRTIDIDILLFDDLTINYRELIIPHPRMFERAFVLIPLKDIYDNAKLFGKDIDFLINDCNDKDGVKLYLEKVR